MWRSRKVLILIVSLLFEMAHSLELYSVEFVGTRVRNSSLERIINCPMLPKGHLVEVLDRVRPDSNLGWWYKIKPMHFDCPSEGLVPEQSLIKARRGGGNPLNYLARNEEYETIARVTIRNMQSGILNHLVDLPVGSELLLNPDNTVGSRDYLDSSGNIKRSRSGWIRQVEIISSPGVSARTLRRWNRLDLYLSQTHRYDIQAKNGNNQNRPIKASGVVAEMRNYAGLGPRPSRRILRTSRGLYRFPLIRRSSNASVCGSFHYNPDSGLVDAYINKKVGWAFLDILHEWNSSCTRSKGCRIAWGDISHKTRKRWNGHKTHTNGHCIDIRPMRKGRFRNSPLRWNHGGYSRTTTEKFIRLLRRKGATKILFNDPRLIAKGIASRAKGHDNHIHVCFNNTSRLKSAGLQVSRRCRMLIQGSIH